MEEHIYKEKEGKKIKKLQTLKALTKGAQSNRVYSKYSQRIKKQSKGQFSFKDSLSSAVARMNHSLEKNQKVSTLMEKNFEERSDSNSFNI